MAKYARQKVAEYEGARVLHMPISDLNWSNFDLVVAVHSLYVIPNPKSTLEKIQRSIAFNNGHGYLCDLGRVLNLVDWRRYLFRAIVQRHGIMTAVRVFFQSRAIARVNRSIRQNQISGNYWTHSTQDFMRTLQEIGFGIKALDPIYRNYSDRAIVVANPNE